ncbi:MAG: serine/threonine protein kinase [Pedosphaera sp.]|nr:serine/threonine protein kinase [Pedosphaera sp.]
MPPQNIGHYRVTTKLGAGGMGEVYRATDTKLGRDVAIKLLLEPFAGNKERLARFAREAQVLASLNHPNIAAIYGLEDSGDSKALVLELVEGETLSERVRRGPLPVEEALEVGDQIARALEAAHEKGIIHRDLKPGNVKLTPDGKVKVLDFGLAKLAEIETTATPSSALEDSPTALADNTRPGTILGTAAYMSPEQAKGKPVDKRTDIWSFGCVLYECLTGKKVFGGETATDSIGTVLHKEPDWTALPPATPASIQLLLRKCLAKDRKHRLHDIADARVDLEHAIANPGTSSMLLAGAAVAAEGRRRGRKLWMTALPWAVALAAVAFAFFRNGSPRGGSRGSSPALRQTYTLLLDPKAPLSTSSPGGSSIVVSPDCSKVVYVGTRDGFHELFWKRTDDADFKPVPESNKSSPNVCFSSESNRLAFWTKDGTLKVFSFDGSNPRTIFTASTNFYTFGAHWGTDNRMVYANVHGIYSIVERSRYAELIGSG